MINASRSQDWALALVGLVLAAGCGLAAATAGLSPELLLLTAEGAAVFLARRWPVAGLSILVLSGASLIDGAQVARVGDGAREVSLAFLCLVPLVGAAALNLRYWWPRRDTRLFVILLTAFVFLATATSVIALAQDQADVGVVVAKLGELALLTAAIPVATLLTAEQRWRFLDVLIIIAVIVSAVSILASAVDAVRPSVTSLAPDSLTKSSGEEHFGPLQRVRLPGLTLTYLMVLPMVSQILFHRSRSEAILRFAGLVVMLAAIAVSFNRNMLIGLVVGSVVMLVVLRRDLRWRGLRVGLGTATALLLCLGVFLFLTPTASEKILERASSLLSPSSLAQSGAVTSREDETDAALKTFRDNPVIGIGAGGDFGIFARPEGGVGRVPQYFVHNQYVEIALYYGIATLLVFLAVLVLALRRSYLQASRAEDDRSSGLQAALCGSIVAIALSAIVGNYFLSAAGALATGLLFGLPFAGHERR